MNVRDFDFVASGFLQSDRGYVATVRDAGDWSAERSIYGNSPEDV